MGKDTQFFEDLFKLAGSAANMVLHSASDAKQKWNQLVDRLVEDLLQRGKFVTREESDVMRDMIEALREENGELKTRLEQLEKQCGK